MYRPPTRRCSHPILFGTRPTHVRSVVASTTSYVCVYVCVCVGGCTIISAYLLFFFFSLLLFTHSSVLRHIGFIVRIILYLHTYIHIQSTSEVWLPLKQTQTAAILLLRKIIGIRTNRVDSGTLYKQFLSCVLWSRRMISWKGWNEIRWRTVLLAL